jgi:twitching motility protein PilT
LANLEGMGIRALLRWMLERDASDLHIRAGRPARLRIDGRIEPLSEVSFTEEQTAAMLRELLSAERWAAFQRSGDLDFACALEGVARFRVNALRARGALGLAIRRIPHEVPSLADLGLPAVCRSLAERPRGLVLVTGPTGSGKTTTLAAMLDHVNATRAGHIVTMEDPIEYVHGDKRCCVTQREIGSDTPDFASALRRALRQDPDVILVGEMRDLETIALTVTAAETGHLVFASLHTTGAVQTVDRIVDVFPAGQQAQIRMQLAGALQGVISQTLVPRRCGGRALAQEILVATDAVRTLVREAKTPQLSNVIQTQAKAGMQTLEMALSELVGRGEVAFEVARSVANAPAQVQPPGASATAPPKPVQRAPLIVGKAG